MCFRKYRKVIIFILDLLILIIVSDFIYFMMLLSASSYHISFLSDFWHIALFVFSEIIFLYIFKTYESLWRYAKSIEYLYLFLGSFLGYIFYLVMDYILLAGRIPILFTTAIYSLSLLAMIFMRLCYHQYANSRKNNKSPNKVSVAIIGAGEAGVRLYEEITSNPNSNYKAVCFLDDDIDKINKKIHNIPVYGPIENMKILLEKTPVNEIIIAIPSITAEKQKEILHICLELRCRVQILPNTIELLQGKEDNLWKRLRDINTEELLGREPILLTNKEVELFLANKIVMVTGGGGSIGSELCRQIAKLNPRQLIIVDMYENNAYDIQQELISLYGSQLDLKTEIASVSNKNKVDLLFERYRPDIIFHAAAYKHVPLMEDCPEEAVRNNIFGTYYVMQAAVQYKASKFILISTDKAVNPTSIMGTTKRFCEIMLRSMKNNNCTEFAAVRFGNVLGSNGSVIPLFQKQIAQGGPVTITDKRMVRFFMTIAEAVELVLQAGAMADDADIYVLDMGAPVKIIDMAENLIRLSGHIPYTEIPIKETGLRPGEKLYEELLINHEKLAATGNQKIFIDHEETIEQEIIIKKLQLLEDALETNSKEEIKAVLKEIVPTYRDPDEVNQEYPGYLMLSPVQSDQSDSLL